MTILHRFLCLSLVFKGFSSLSQEIPQSTNPYFSSLEWRNIGPFRGGRSCAVTGVPNQPNVFYFGATGGGVWKTTDAGNTYFNVSDGYFGGSIGAIAIAPSDPNIIYVGQGEETVRGNVSSGYGVWKSEDAGRSWEFMGLKGTKHISRIRIHPKNPDIVMVAAMGDLYKDTEERGVYKTTSGGKSWNKVLFSDKGSGAIDLTFDPTNPKYMYASTWTFRRTPYSFSSGGKGSKLFKSSDMGETWEEISDQPGFPKGLLGIIGVTVSPINPDRVWAMVENEPDGGLYRSDDAGKSWKKINSERKLRQRAWYYTRIYADTKDADKVYVLNVRYHMSADGGRTFKTSSAPHGDHHDLWIAPEEPNRMIIGDDGGAQISFDAGKNWSRYTNQPTAQFYRVTTDDSFPFRIYGGQQDNSSVRIAHRSSGGYITESDWEETAGGEAGHHAIYPANNDIVFGGEYGGLMLRINHDSQEFQATNVWPNNPLGHGVKDMKYRFQWNYPLFFSSHNKERLYAFSNHVHYSDDFGNSWTTASPDLTTNDTTKQQTSGGPITKDNTAVEYYCTLFAAAEDVKNPQIMWTGSDDGRVHISRDGLQSWTEVTPKDLPEFTQINCLEADPHTEGGVYLAGTRYKWGDFEPYLYYSNNFGKSWERIDKGIARNHFTRAIRADENKKGLIYVGTEYGMYASLNNGNTWETFQQNLPMVPITDLAIKDRHLIAATQGRSFWIIDDLSPLYEMEEEFSAKKHLFTPKPSYFTDGYQAGTSRTQGTNHPGGVILNYYLEELDSSTEYTLTFSDADGKVVRTYSNQAKEKANKWEPKAGSHRFIWNLRTSSVSEVPGMILWWSMTRGPRVVPGEYTATLSDGTYSQTVPITLLKDPRITSSQEDLQAQYDFLNEIKNNLDSINAVILEIRSTREPLGKLLTQIEDSVLKTDIQKVLDDGDQIEKALYQTQNKSPQDPLNFPIRLNNKYGHVGALAEVGNFRPTESMLGVKEELEIEINQQFILWEETKSSLPSINRRARDLEIPYIQLGSQKTD